MDQDHLDLAMTTLQQPSKDIQLQPKYYDGNKGHNLKPSVCIHLPLILILLYLIYL